MTCCDATRKRAKEAAGNGVWPHYTCPHCGTVWRGGTVSRSGKIRIVEGGK